MSGFRVMTVSVLKHIGLYNCAVYFILHFEAMRAGIKLTILKDSISIERGNKIVKVRRSHAPYAYDVIKHFDYYFEAVIPRQLGVTFVVDYSSMGMHILAVSKLGFFFTALAESEETNDIYLKKSNIKNGDVVFDIGAYCGVSTYFFSKMVGAGGTVISFEPDQQNLIALEKNIATYSLANVKVIPKAVWKQNCYVSFQGEGNMGSAIKGLLERQTSASTVEAVTLGAVCKEFNLNRVDFIKMDIEGAEVAVLESSRNFLKDFKPRMIIETHMVQGKRVTPEVCEILRELGYEVEILSQGDLECPLVFACPK